MNQSVKDELVTLLDTSAMRRQYGYAIEVVERGDFYPPESGLRYKIILTVDGTLIVMLDQLIGLMYEVDSCITFFLDTDHGGSLLVF